MRTTVTLLLSTVLIAAAPACLRAEVIHLKNGRTIWAERVRENGSHLEYDIGEDSYAIPKSLVDHVDAGGVPPTSHSDIGANKLGDLPSISPADDLKNDPTLQQKVVHQGKVDTEALLDLEQAGNANATSTGYFLAGKFEFDRGNLAEARRHFEAGLRFAPEDPTILNYYAALLVKTGHATEALPFAERAVRVAPDSPDTLAVLGYVQFAADRTAQAIRTWKRSLELRPDAQVRKYLEKAQRDAHAEANFTERESNHFTLRFEGEETSESFRSQILIALESAYDDLVRELGVSPRESIPVILYTDQAFFDVTQAPSWTGALNDGKLRIPVHGMSTVTPEMSRVLKHELAHSFINQLSAGRCPGWLNEGIAQAMEPKQVANGRLLSALFRSQHEIPINALEGTFIQFSPMQAAIAYDESLAAVLYITNTNSMGDLQQILAKLAQGSSAEAALREVIHIGYNELETDLGKYLEDTYGH